MKLTIEIISSSFIMMMLGGGATSVNPRDMNFHRAQEQEMRTSKIPQSLSSSVIRGNSNSKNQRRHDHHRGRSRQVQETNSTDDDNYTDELNGGCDDVGADYFHNALDFSLSPLFDEVECWDDKFIGHSYCTWGNLTADAHLAGVFDNPIQICQDDGGTYYNIRGQVDCDDQSTTFLNYHPFGCFSDCSDQKLQSLSSLFPAEPFAIASKDNTTSKCEWLSFEAYSTTIYNADLYGTCNDVIAGQNHVSDAFDALYQKYYNVTCKDDGKHCKEMTYSNAYNDGAFDNILAPCQEEGGELYVDTITMDCGVDGSTEYLHYPHCVANCTVDKWAKYITDESLLWDDCTYVGDYEIFQYTSDNNGTEVCAQVETDEYALALFAVMQGIPEVYTCDDKCKFDFTSALEGGQMDTLIPTCTMSGGDLFIGNFEIDCGTSGIINYIEFPICMSDCSLDQMMDIYYEGGDVESGGVADCTFTSIEEIFVYVSNEEEGEGGATPTVSTVAADTPTMTPVSGVKEKRKISAAVLFGIILFAIIYD